MTKRNERINIAIVDDHFAVRDGLSFLLKQNTRYQLLHSVSSGEEYIATLQRTNSYPDITLMDISLKGMDGFETIEKARLLYHDTSFIMYTGHEGIKYRKRAYQMNVAAYIYKGSEYVEIIEAIENITNNCYIYYNTYYNPKLLLKENDALPLKEIEHKLLVYICQGLTEKEIADKMCLSKESITKYKSGLMQKTGTSKNIGLVKYAIKHGIFILPE